MEEKFSGFQDKNRCKNSLININTHFQNLSMLSEKEINLLELKCLKGNKEILTPVRGTYCIHLECYDEKTLLNFFKFQESFLCNLCGKIISENNLIKDQFLHTIMKNKQYKSGTPIKIFKSSGNWCFAKSESIDPVITTKGEIEEMSKYINRIQKDVDVDFIIHSDLNSEKFNLDIFTNTFSTTQLNEKFHVNTFFNFARKNYIYSNDDRKIRNDSCIKIYLDFFHEIEKQHRDDKKILPLIMNEIYAYVLFVSNLRSIPIFTIDYHFLEQIEFANSNPEFYFISALFRILTEIIRVEDFIIVLLLKSDDQIKNFSENFKISFIHYEELCSKVKTYKEIDFDKEKQKSIDSSINKLNLNNSTSYYHSNSNNEPAQKGDIFKIIYNDTYSTKSKFLDKDNINYGKNLKFSDNFYKFSITSNINKESIDILSPNLCKFLIISNNLIYSNITDKKEDNVFFPIEINLDVISYFVCSNYNGNEFKLVSQFKTILKNQNFILTNLKEFNSDISLQLIESKLDCIQLLNVLTTSKQKKQNFVIFVDNLRAEELKEILFKYNFFDNPNFYSESNVFYSFMDEFEFSYFFILDKENIYDEIFYYEFEKIFTELKKSKFSVSSLYLRNKMILINEKIFYEIRKTKET